MIGINPTVDFAFKLLLGSPEHARVTIHFLNAILGDELRITQVEIKNPYLGKSYDDDKLVILDILAIDEHGRRLNIEMQTSLPAGLKQRLAFYDARLYAEQLSEGVEYTELRPAIVICVLSVAMFPGQEHLHSDFRLRDGRGNVLTNDLQVHLLELTKLKVSRENLVKSSAVERRACFLREAETMTVDEVRKYFPEPEFSEAAEVLEMIKKTPEQFGEYNARMKLRLDESARLAYARQEGVIEGEVIGQIRTLQKWLGIDTPTREEMSGYTIAQLNELASRLDLQLQDRQRDIP